MGIEALLTSQVIGLDAALTGKLNTTGGTLTGALAITQGTANASVLTSTGYSLTGSNAQSLVDLAGTWNTSGTPTLIKANVTDTASNASSLLMDLQVGGASKFIVQKDANVRIEGSGLYVGSYALDSGISANINGMSVLKNGSAISGCGDNGWHVTTNRGYHFGANTSTLVLSLYYDADDTLAQRRSTNAQTFRLYNTYTSSTSFENLQLQWSSNEARIGTSVGSAGGTQRNLVLGTWDSAGAWAGAVTIGSSGSVKVIRTAVSGGYNAFNETLRAENLDNASLNIVSATNRSSHIYFSDTAYAGHIQYYHGDDSFNFFTAGQKRIVLDSSGCIQQTPTWNNVATTFTGILANVTDTASASGSLLMDLQVGGSSVASINKTGNISLRTIAGENAPGGNRTILSVNGPRITFTNAGSNRQWMVFDGQTGGSGHENLFALRVNVDNPMVAMRSDAALTWSANTSSVPINTADTTHDLRLYRDAANTLAQRNSTNAQTFRIYNTYTSATSYERGKIEWDTNVLKIGTEKGSAGGSARALELQTDGTTRLTISDAGLFTIADALNIAVGTTTGTKIGTGTTQKIGFWDKTPVVQPTAVADATDAASVITQLNALLSRMRDLGLIAT